MSHRVTTGTEIKDRELAIDALKQASMSFTANGDNELYITSGPIQGCHIDLNTGVISGDSDHHKRNDDSLGLLKRYYAEAKVMKELRKRGISVKGRVVEKDGTIKLRCRGQFGG